MLNLEKQIIESYFENWVSLGAQIFVITAGSIPDDWYNPISPDLLPPNNIISVMNLLEKDRSISVARAKGIFVQGIIDLVEPQYVIFADDVKHNCDVAREIIRSNGIPGVALHVMDPYVQAMRTYHVNFILDRVKYIPFFHYAHLRSIDIRINSRFGFR